MGIRLIGSIFVFITFVTVAFANDPERESQRPLDYSEVEAANNFESLSSLVHTDDPQKARLVLQKLDSLRTEDNRIEQLLETLWSASNNHPIYKHPIPRVKLAEILWKIEKEKKYANYIFSQVSHTDWKVQAGVAEALAAIPSADSVSFLKELARVDNAFVARTSINSLGHMANHSQFASEINKFLRDIRKSSEQPIINDAIDNVLSNKGSKTNNATLEEETGSANEYLGKEDYKSAIEAVLPAAENGDPSKQHMVGELFLALDEPDYSQALYWLRESVDQNYAPAKVSLAHMYLYGKGIKVDRSKAIGLLESAKSQGYKPAEKLLSIINQNK